MTYWQYQHSTEDRKQEVGATSANTSSVLLKQIQLQFVIFIKKIILENTTSY